MVSHLSLLNADLMCLALEVRRHLDATVEAARGRPGKTAAGHRHHAPRRPPKRAPHAAHPPRPATARRHPDREISRATHRKTPRKLPGTHRRREGHGGRRRRRNDCRPTPCGGPPHHAPGRHAPGRRPRPRPRTPPPPPRNKPPPRRRSTRSSGKLPRPPSGVRGLPRSATWGPGRVLIFPASRPSAQRCSPRPEAGRPAIAAPAAGSATANPGRGEGSGIRMRVRIQASGLKPKIGEAAAAAVRRAQAKKARCDNWTADDADGRRWQKRVYSP